MSESFEKSLVGVLGGVIGLALSSLVISFGWMHAMNTYEVHTYLLIGGTSIGILAAFIVVEYRKEKELEFNNRTRSKMTALITHEIRTGLTSTGWAINFILKNYAECIKQEDKQLLEGIAESVHSTVMRSSDLLDVSLLDIRKLTLSLSWVSLQVIGEMVREILAVYVVGAERKGVKIISSVDLDANKEAEVDLVRLRIIIENLLDNAVQYSTGDVKEVTLTVSSTDKVMSIQVADRGIGIPVSEQHKIFGEFYRASNARQKLINGTGIGLYMVKQYVEAHKGTIRFESVEGRGTTFYVSIPLKTAEDVNEFMKKI